MHIFKVWGSYEFSYGRSQPIEKNQNHSFSPEHRVSWFWMLWCAHTGQAPTVLITLFSFFKRTFYIWLLHNFLCWSISLHVHVLCSCLQRSEGVESPRTWVTESYELPCGFWELALGPLEEQNVFLITESTLGPHMLFSKEQVSFMHRGCLHSW